MRRYRVSAIALVIIVFITTVWISPGRSQEKPSDGGKVEEKDTKSNIREVIVDALQPAKTSDPTAATTIEDVKISIEELKVLVKPLTLDELRNEEAAWMLALRGKAQEISEAEVTIKRQNQAINNQQEGADALSQAKQSLQEAEKEQKGKAPGSPQYQEAAKKVEDAKENLKKAEESVEKAKTAKATLREDDTSRKALEKAKQAGDLEAAKKALEQKKEDRNEAIAGSPPYAKAAKTVDRLAAAIASVEKAEEAQTRARPDSPEAEQAAVQIEQVYAELEQVLKDIGVANTENKPSTVQSSQTLNQTTDVLENTQIKVNGDAKVAGSPGSAPQQKLQQQQQQLTKATEQLQKSTDNESEAKNQLVVTVTELQGQLTAIADRLNVVLDAMEKKGGDVESDRQYLQAVTAVDIDTKDAEGIGMRLLTWGKSEEGGFRWMGNIGKFVGIIITWVIASQLLGLLLDRLLALFGNASSRMMRQFVVMVVKRGGLVVGFLIALTALEVSIGPVLALLGGVTFILAFALQSNLGNLASGLMIMVYKPFDVNDEVKIGSLWGKVETITLANTRIKGLDGQMFSVPNSKVWSDTVENLSHGKARKISLPIRVGFDQNLRRVEQILVETMKSHPQVLENPAPTTSIKRLEEYYIPVGASAWTQQENYWEVLSDLIRMVQERFQKEGIEFAAIPKVMNINQEAHDGNGNASHFLESPTHQATGSTSEHSTGGVTVMGVEPG